MVVAVVPLNAGNDLPERVPLAAALGRQCLQCGWENVSLLNFGSTPPSS